MAEICGHCGYPRGSRQEADKNMRAISAGIQLAALTKIEGMPEIKLGNLSSEVGFSAIMGAKPYCWQRNDEACRQWTEWEAEDNAAYAAEKAAKKAAEGGSL